MQAISWELGVLVFPSQFVPSGSGLGRLCQCTISSSYRPFPSVIRQSSVWYRGSDLESFTWTLLLSFECSLLDSRGELLIAAWPPPKQSGFTTNNWPQSSVPMKNNCVFRQGSVKLTQHQACRPLQRRGVPKTTQKMPSGNSSADTTMPGTPRGFKYQGTGPWGCARVQIA